MLMSYALMGQYLFAPEPTSPTERAVLNAMAYYADDDGSNCFPSVATLMDRTGYGRRTVQETLRSLEAGKHVRQDGEVGTGPGHMVRRYRLRVPRAATAPGGATDAPGGRGKQPEGAREMRPTSHRPVNGPESRANADDFSYLDEGIVR